MEQIAVYTYKNRTDEEAKEALKIQKQSLKQYCIDNGYNNIIEYDDIGGDRSAQNEMLDRILRINDIDKVIVTRRTVLTRNMIKYSEIKELLIQRGVEMVNLENNI